MTTTLWIAGGTLLLAGLLALACAILAGWADQEADRFRRAVEASEELGVEITIRKPKEV